MNTLSIERENRWSIVFETNTGDTRNDFERALFTITDRYGLCTDRWRESVQEYQHDRAF